MTDTHDALYRAICAHPDEDTPRLAFADLIDEAGDHHRARFIRAQIALARVPTYDPARVAARRHDPDAAAGWAMAHTLPKLPAGFGWHRYEFRRGFPWKAAVRSWSGLRASGESVFEAAPVQALDVCAPDRPSLSHFATWQPLARIRKLEVSVGWNDDDDVAALADSEHAAGLTELAFEFDGLAPDGVAALAGSALFRRLSALELRSVTADAALLVDSLAATRGPGALARLALPFNRLGRDDAEHLFALPIVHGLHHLDVGDNPLGVGGVTALAESGVVHGLRVLGLSRTRPGVPGVKALVEAGGLAGLRALDLSDNRLGAVAVKALAGCAGFRGLRALDLSNNLVGDAGAAALAGAPALAGLLELDLRDADVFDAGARALAESPHLDNLLRLDLRTRGGRAFGAAARAALVERFGERVCL